MTINHNNPKKIHVYDSDDRQLLVGLLHEYSDKLVETSREIVRKGIKLDKEKQGSKESLIFCLLMLSCISISYLLWAWIVSSINGANMIETIYYWSVGFFTNVVFTSILLFAAVVVLYSDNFIEASINPYISKSDREKKIEDILLQKDAQILANRLESAMRLTVEISDQIETNLARKLELDLRIADASYALEYYYSIMGSHSKSAIKPQKSIFSRIAFRIKKFFFHQ